MANMAQLTPFVPPAQSSFHQFDRDRSGALDRGEVHHALTAAGGLRVQRSEPEEGRFSQASSSL